MAEVVPIPWRRRAAGAEGSARLTELRTRLGRELEDLSNEVMREADRRLILHAAGNGAGTGGDGARRRRMRLLGQLIAGLAAVEEDAVWDDRAGYGSSVFLRDLDSGEERFCTLMSGSLIDEEAGQVSLHSPLGRALLGCRAGDEPVVETPAGSRRLRVFAVHTLPQSLGMSDAGPRGAA